MAKIRRDANLASLAARVERALTEGDEDGFINGGFATSEYKIVLGGIVEFNAEIPDFERQKIVNRVAHDRTLRRPISADVLLDACTSLEKVYLAQPKKAFRLLTEISINQSISVPKLRIDGVTLTFSPKNRSGFKQRAELFSENRISIGQQNLPPLYTELSASLLARTPFEAADRALKAIDLFRAGLNLPINRGKSWRYSSGRPSPINDICLAPFHTIHIPNGTLATETFWYEPGYRRATLPFFDEKKFKELSKYSTKLRALVAKSPYKGDLEDGMVRYVRALDSADLNDAFLRLWSLLEFLTDSTRDPKDLAAQRAAFLFTDSDRSRLVLSHLALHRNRFVHAGSDSDEIEELVFLLKRYVDALLLFHIANSFGFKSRAEAALFLSLPKSLPDIEAKLYRLKQAKSFRKGRG